MITTANVIRVMFLALFIFLLVIGKPMLWLALFAISLIAAVFFSKIFCGYVCPMNTLMIPAEWLSKKFKPKAAPKWLGNGYFAWVSLGLSIVVVLLSRKLLQINLPFLFFWLVIAILVTLLYKPAVFHNLICPFGLLQRAFGRFARFSEKVNKDACIGCDLCGKVCPANAIVVESEDKKATINTTLCIQCTNCRQVCPKNAISYSK